MRRSARHKLLYQNLILAAALLPPGAAIAQPAVSASASSAPAMAIEETVVTGTRRTDRSVTESTVPVDVFTADTIAAQPTGDMVETLKNLVPSLSVGRNSIRDGSAFIRQPNLRGLAPDETLVLINGKRFHKSALVSLNANSLFAGSQGVDLNQIPSSAVGRIDVLRDGASAQYGSDAIAGVINYTLKSDHSGFTADGRVGQYSFGDGGEVQMQGNLGLPLGAGFFDISADYRNAGSTARVTQRPNALVLSALGYSVANPTQKYGNPSVNSYHMFFNSAVPLTDNVEVYAFGNYGHSQQSDGFFFRTPIDVNVPVPASSGLQSLFAKSVPTTYLDTIVAPDPRPGANFGKPTTFANANGRTYEVSSMYPNGFTPQLYGELEDYSANGGARGKIGGINYDLSGSFGYNSIAYTLANTVNASMGPDTTKNLYIGKLIQQETNLNADFSYPLEIGLASPLNIAIGGEYRRENYRIRQGETNSWLSGQYAVQQVYNANTNTVSVVTHAVGANGLPGYGPDSVADQSRRSYAAYVDLEADIVRDLTVGVAGRYEHFSDFGSTTNGKVSARYAFTPEIAVRGALSTGFKAPTPGQLFTRNVSTAFLVGTGVPYELGLLPPTDPAAKFYGATPMKPEKSTNMSAGVVLTPANDVNVTIDYFHIKVTDRIGITGQIPVLDSDRTKLQALGVANWATIGQLRYFTNGFSTATQGLDVVGTYDMNTDIGDFATTLSANYTATEVRSRKNTVTPDGRSFVLIDDTSKGNIENLIPKIKGNIGETYSAGPWQVTGRVNFFGNFTQYTLINNVITPQTFGAQATVDLAVNYDVTDNVRLTAGGENILNSYPSKERRGIYPITNSTANGSIYLDDSPDGYNGAFVYARVSLRFD